VTDHTIDLAPVAERDTTTLALLAALDRATTLVDRLEQATPTGVDRSGRDFEALLETAAQRAARPYIAVADAAAAGRVAEAHLARDAALADLERRDSLIAELRRQLDAALMVRDRAGRERDAALASVAQLRAGMPQVLTYGYRTPPQPEDIAVAVAGASGGTVVAREVDTGGQDHVLVLAPAPWTPEQAAGWWAAMEAAGTASDEPEPDDATVARLATDLVHGAGGGTR